MTDKEMREKVVEGLEWCMNEKHDCYREKGCPYENEGEDIGCKYALHRDALALLKAQEPGFDGKSQEVISGFTLYCPNCGFANTRWGTISPRGNTVFKCGKCGMEVKWE